MCLNKTLTLNATATDFIHHKFNANKLAKVLTTSASKQTLIFRSSEASTVTQPYQRYLTELMQVMIKKNTVSNGCKNVVNN